MQSVPASPGGIRRQRQVHRRARAAGGGLPQILGQVLRAAHKIGAEFLGRPVQHQRVGGQLVAG